MYVDRADFLRWAYSDLLSNRERGVLAEYIVGKCLNAVSGNRIEWDAYDLKTDYGAKIEVKSSAYLQSWQQTKLSTIRFNIAEKIGWSAETNIVSTSPMRCADIYVFCVLTETDPALVDPLSAHQWQFFVASTTLINSQLGNQKSLSLSRLKEIAGAGIHHSELSTTVRANYRL